MTNFVDIYQDLPSRVSAVWERLKSMEQQQDQHDLSVTAMLMAAAAGLAMPFENLKDLGAGNSKKLKEHPMFSEVEPAKYKVVLKNCDDFFKKPIRKVLADACLVQCKKLKDVRDAAFKKQGDATLDTSRYDMRFALKIFRNALAHNNILSIPDAPDAPDQISHLAFFSKSNGPSSSWDEGVNVLIIPAPSFKTFLEKWFELLRPLGGIQGATLATAGL